MKIKYLSWLQKEIGKSDEDIELVSRIQTLSDLLDHLTKRGGGYTRAFKSRGVIFGEVSGRVISHSDSIVEANEVTLFAPVVGG